MEIVKLLLIIQLWTSSLCKLLSLQCNDIINSDNFDISYNDIKYIKEEMDKIDAEYIAKSTGGDVNGVIDEYEDRMSAEILKLFPDFKKDTLIQLLHVDEIQLNENNENDNSFTTHYKHIAKMYNLLYALNNKKTKNNYKIQIMYNDHNITEISDLSVTQSYMIRENFIHKYPNNPIYEWTTTPSRQYWKYTGPIGTIGTNGLNTNGEPRPPYYKRISYKNPIHCKIEAASLLRLRIILQLPVITEDNFLAN
ncbi:hypothetical protein A3Q56_02022 [Intoshia linei]|uniref:Uncharacterized protein n=1 Tax=Intoshia linei TaxID=1819745 RepID=A0A177B7G0_9BILA|nr:hypothetical protein A3Q56_02022 [Intoshia linei]